MSTAKSNPAIRFLAAMAVVALAIRPGVAHEGDSHDGHSHDGHNHGGEVIAFQLSRWQQRHFEDPQLVERHVQALKDLGCDVREDAHEGHSDVGYRCPQWRSISVAEHELAVRWERWLQDLGFDTFHSHVDTAFQSGAESIELRLTEWKTVHGNSSNAAEIRKFADTLAKVGCQAEVNDHGNHIDVRFRCPIWTQISVADHATAERWMQWLDSNGFEVRHEH